MEVKEEELTIQIQNTNKSLQEANDFAMSLELQLDTSDSESTPWFTQGNNVRVEGEDDILSIFWKFELHAYWRQFNSLGHALHYKKMLYHQKWEDAEAVKVSASNLKVCYTDQTLAHQFL